MKTISSTTGYLVEELEDGVDTEDLTLEGPAIGDLADRWEALADTYARGEMCAACMWSESGVDARGIRWRECACFDPATCPGVNGDSIPAYLRRQAS